MTEERKSIHGQWSSRMAFILAATGSAVGLGNIWKFPYITGENGGGAFVLIYLLCIVLIGTPIMMSEILLGRRGRQSPINTMRALAREEGRSRHWQWLGWTGVVAGFLILSYYSVVAGWALAYVVKTANGVFTHVTSVQVGEIFDGLVSSPGHLLFWHTVFMTMTMVVVGRGVKSGLEQAVRFLMPSLFILLLVLVGYSMSSGAFAQGIEFLFSPDFSKLGGESVLTAMGHAFFTLSLGMGAIMVYGSYLPKNTSITQASFYIAGADTLVALLASMTIFPIVFANGLEPGAGPGLIFQTLPIAFGQMWGGAFFGTLFFVLLVFAAWTSAISLIEPAVAWLVENHNVSRVKASVIAGIATWLVGIGTALSFNAWKHIKLLGLTFFDLLDKLTANIMLPLGGVAIAVFVAWILSRESTRSELNLGDGAGYTIWRFLVRYISPVAVMIVFIFELVKLIKSLLA